MNKNLIGAAFMAALFAGCATTALPPEPGERPTAPQVGEARKPDLQPCRPRDPEPGTVSALCTVSPTAPPSGGTIYVDIASTVTGNGSLETPFRSIGAATDYATAGATIIVKPGVYRETASVRVDNLKLLGEPGAVIKGSRIESNWTQEGSYWVTAYAHNTSGTQFYLHGQCRSGSNNRCRLPDQAYIDGVPQFQETALAAVGVGDFWIGNGKLYLGSDPRNKLVELAARTSWVKGNGTAANAVIKGFVMKHAGNQAQSGAVSDGGGDGWLVEGNEVSYAHAIGIKLDGDNAVVRGNTIHTNGQMGVSSTRASGQLWELNEISRNQTEDFNPGWEGGGSKFVQARRLTVRANTVSRNDGPGLWCDIDCGWDPVLLKADPADTVRFLDNKVDHNSWYGIVSEISYSVLMQGNQAWENGWTDGRGWLWDAGLACQNSSGCRIVGNVSVWNADGISAIRQARGENGIIFERWTAVDGVEISGNLVATTGDHVVEYRSDTSLYTATNITTEPNECYTGPNPILSAKLEALGLPTAPEAR